MRCDSCGNVASFFIEFDNGAFRAVCVRHYYPGLWDNCSKQLPEEEWVTKYNSRNITITGIEIPDSDCIQRVSSNIVVEYVDHTGRNQRKVLECVDGFPSVVEDPALEHAFKHSKFWDELRVGFAKRLVEKLLRWGEFENFCTSLYVCLM